MQLIASPGVTWDASSKMTTSKRMSGGRYWLTARGDIMKHGLIACVTCARAFHQPPYRHVLLLLAGFAADDSVLTHVAARAPGVACRDDSGGRAANERAVKSAVLGHQGIAILGPDEAQSVVATQVEVSPPLQERAFENQRHLSGANALTDAEIDGSIETNGRQLGPGGLVSEPFVLSGAILTQSRDEVLCVRIVVEICPQFRLPALFKGGQQLGTGLGPPALDLAQLRRRDHMRQQLRLNCRQRFIDAFGDHAHLCRPVQGCVDPRQVCLLGGVKRTEGRRVVVAVCGE